MSSLTGINLRAEKSAHLVLDREVAATGTGGGKRAFCYAQLRRRRVWGRMIFRRINSLCATSKYGATALWVVLRLAAGQIAITSGTSRFWLRQNDAKSLRNFSPAGR